MIQPPAPDAHPLHLCPIPVPYYLVETMQRTGPEQSSGDVTAAFVENPHLLIYQADGDGIRRVFPGGLPPVPSGPDLCSLTAPDDKDLNAAIKVRRDVGEGEASFPVPETLDGVTREVLVLPRSERWRETVSTALLGNWIAPLFHTGYLPNTALGALKAEARTGGRHRTVPGHPLRLTRL